MNSIGQVPAVGETVTIRPITPADCELEQDFIRSLSTVARHFRFFGGVSELPPGDLRRLCSVDGVNSMAYVATVVRDGREVGIGVGRFAPGDRFDTREMAVTVADSWQRSGLGATLVRKLVEPARRNGVRRLYSVDLTGNVAMAAIASELQMSATPDPQDPHQVIYSLDL
jgi:GNAT superfamily N-acetyltransferase